MGRTDNRKRLDADVRMQWLETDLDAHEREHREAEARENERLRKIEAQHSRILWVLISLLLTIVGGIASYIIMSALELIQARPN